MVDDLVRPSPTLINSERTVRIMSENRKLYQGLYRSELEEEVVTPNSEPENTTPENDPTETPEDRNWKKRYGDLRTHNNSLTERIKTLETQLTAAQRQEVKIPSSPQEIEAFARSYPDIYRHVKSIAMHEVLQQKEDLTKQIEVEKEKLDKIEKETGYKKILSVHPDFEELNLSEQFHAWAAEQPKQIQDWLFESTDPTLCIKALDLYKAEHNFKKQKTEKKPGADSQVKTRTAPEMPNEGSKKVWKNSEIARMNRRDYEKFESELELARAEGRIDLSA
jgi:hypothetical protein